MDRETVLKNIVLLEQACKKWDGVAFNGNSDMGTENCQLCNQYSIPFLESKCGFCPVRLKTKLDSCSGTPYNKWRFYTMHNDHLFPIFPSVFDDHSRRLAIDMLIFLTELLDEYREKLNNFQL